MEARCGRAFLKLEKSATSGARDQITCTTARGLCLFVRVGTNHTRLAAWLAENLVRSLSALSAVSQRYLLAASIKYLAEYQIALLQSLPEIKSLQPSNIVPWHRLFPGLSTLIDDHHEYSPTTKYAHNWSWRDCTNGGRCMDVFAHAPTAD